MTISLDEMVTEVRRYFRDVKWSNDTLKAWVRDAVRDYSQHFPQVKEAAVIAIAGTYEYDINDLVLAVIEVEYPSGEDPPEYPEQRNHREPHFFGDGVSYYDVVLYPGQGEAELWLSDPQAGETCSVKYYTGHDWTAEGSDYKTDIADEDRHVLVQYVIWQCWRETLTMERETADADRRAYLQEQAADAASSYSYYINQIKANRSAESEFVRWKMDKFDRIY
jgi:hypothetical protein